MSTKDLKRIEASTAVKERRIKQQDAARILGISPRQFIAKPYTIYQK